MIIDKVKLLPKQPGVYQYKNKLNEVIYVGKAKNLFNRVNQYFKNSQNSRITKMVSEAVDVEILVTKNEKEALILEHNIIKKKNPKYNILLKDSKRYPYIFISDDKFPKIEVTRFRRKKGKYFGPFPDGTRARDTVKLLDRMFPLRKCKTIPKEECLYYHINQCLAPCIKEIKDEEVKMIIADIEQFLSGNSKKVVEQIKTKMNKASENLEYEKANDFKKTIERIKAFTDSQNVESKDMKSKDIIGYNLKNGYLQISHILMRQGQILDINKVFYELFQNIDDAITSYLYQWYQVNEAPKEVLIDSSVDINQLEKAYDLKVIYPQKSKGYELIEMANNNAKTEMEIHYLSRVHRLEVKRNSMQKLSKLLNKNISTFEIFDNSHTMGDNPVGVMVHYKDGDQIKSMSRKYNIQSSTDDDYASMREIVYRRYSSLKPEEMPDLIIVDGGKGQISSALDSLKVLKLDIAIIGLSKDGKHATANIVYNNEVISLAEDKDFNLFLANVQDTVHNYAIRFHRTKKRKSIISSYLDSIVGIGAAYKSRVLKEYPTIYDLKSTTEKDLTKIVPKNIAIKLLEKVKEA